MSLVLDSSATIAQVFYDERTQLISEIFDHVAQNGAWVPELWRIEVLNTLNVGIRRGRINKDDRTKILEHLTSLSLNFDWTTHQYCWTDTLHLADKHKLTVYDATYLELAVRRSLPLATLDQELRTAATSEGITLLGL